MSYITVQEATEKWGVSERLVRRYCAQNRIPGLVQYDGIWQIPEDEKGQHQKQESRPKPLRYLKLLSSNAMANSIAASMSICRSTWSTAVGVWQAIV